MDATEVPNVVKYIVKIYILNHNNGNKNTNKTLYIGKKVELPPSSQITLNKSSATVVNLADYFWF